MWVARDKDNKLVLYEFKPDRHHDKWYDWDNGTFYGIIELDEALFPDLKWEDEPLEIKLIPSKITEDNLDNQANRSANDYMYSHEHLEPHWDKFYIEGYKSGYQEAITNTKQ